MLRWWLPDHFQIVHAGEGEETGREKMRSGRIAGKPHTRQKEFCTAVEGQPQRQPGSLELARRAERGIAESHQSYGRNSNYSETATSTALYRLNGP